MAKCGNRLELVRMEVSERDVFPRLFQTFFTGHSERKPTSRRPFESRVYYTALVRFTLVRVVAVVVVGRTQQ